MLLKRQLIPPLSIHTSDGRTVRAWDFKQKKSLVIVFLDANCALCRDFLLLLAARAQAIIEKNAVALIVFLETPSAFLIDALPPGIIAGADVSGRSARSFLEDAAVGHHGSARTGVFVTDRYGELFDQWQSSRHEFPPFSEVLSTLHQIEIACEECTYPSLLPPEE
ncbi:MAG: hypothetical protein WBS18_05115 [Candidatus Acidiferrales bacterium]